MGGNTRKPIRRGDNDAQMVGEPIKIPHSHLGISDFHHKNLKHEVGIIRLLIFLRYNTGISEK